MIQIFKNRACTYSFSIKDESNNYQFKLEFLDLREDYSWDTKVNIIFYDNIKRFHYSEIYNFDDLNNENMDNMDMKILSYLNKIGDLINESMYKDDILTNLISLSLKYNYLNNMLSEEFKNTDIYIKTKLKEKYN